MRDLLPIGSVVLLNDGEKRLTIIGIIQTDPTDGKQYDYLACLYPEGFIGLEHIYLFNHEDICNVDAEGFTDEEYRTFRGNLSELLKEQEEVPGL